MIYFPQIKLKMFNEEWAEPTIITGQFVRISQTPLSIGERLLALVIDYSLIVIYLYSVTTLIVKLHLSSGVGTVFFLCLVYLPVLFYSSLPLRNVQSPGEFRKTSDEYTRRKSHN